MRSTASRVDAIILAAGGSRRMGAPKALLDVDGEPLVLWHARVFAEMDARVCVVVGAHADAIIAVLPRWVRVVHNTAWETTDPAASAALGLAGCGVALVTPVDVPPARPRTIAGLLAAGAPAVPQFEGLDGHPLLLAPPHPPVRLDRRAESATRVAVDDPDCVLNLNTPAAFAAWRHGRVRG